MDSSTEPTVSVIDPTEEDDEYEDIRCFRDPVFDIISFDDFTCSIIDTPQFQRLRYLKQLGTSYFVYPGSSHNRFEHCLGTAHLAKKLVCRLRERQPSLRITDRDVQCVTLAALCHDLGHGPFSHVFDNVFIPRVFESQGKTTDWCHEAASEMMLDALITENNIDLPQDRIDFIKDLIRGESRKSKNHIPPEKPFLFDIVANKRNGLDVDKWDYIARDTRAVGESCAQVASRLTEAARVVKGTIAYNWKDSQSVYDLFHARYTLHKKIYNHKTAKAIEHMVVDALVAAEPAYKFSEAIEDPKKYLYMTDSVLEEIERSDNPALAKAKKIINDIRCRRVPKMVEQKCLPWQFKKLWEDHLTPKHIAEMSAKLIEEKSRRLVLETIQEESAMDDDVARETRQDDVAAPISLLLPPVDLASVSSTQGGTPVGEEEPLKEDDILIDWSILHFGMKDKDPMQFVSFWGKNMPSKITPSRPDQHGNLRPDNYQEAILRCYSRDPSETKKLQVQEAFRKVLETLPNDFDTPASSQSLPADREPPTPFVTEFPRSNDSSFVADTPSASPSAPGRRGASATPFATHPNGFTTLPTPGGSKKRRRDGDHGAEGSPDRKKRA